ncbi:MAG: outer membrane lipoprotein carrier protein LolA [Flavobacteriaceae bacterium]|nr:outer membrane lipoprotein carrier protein LolA [Flavobacteriaceae bacterium]
MNKYLFFMVSFFVLNTQNCISQENKMSNEEASQLRTNIIEKSKKTVTIVSEFEQFKHLDFLSNDIKSSGNLVFKSPNLIKWEYLIPFNYSVVFKNDKLFINDEGVKSKIDLSSNKTFKSLNNLIIKSVRGDMFDDKLFDMQYFEIKKKYIIKFIPKENTLKSMIRVFILSFDKNSLNVIEIKMQENAEDYTLLKFINQKINTIVSDEVFSN